MPGRLWAGAQSRTGVEAAGSWAGRQGVVLDELTGGAWELAGMDRQRLLDAARIVVAYSGVPIGVTDASIIALAAAYRTREIVTLDRRHFSILRLEDGSAPTLLP